MKERPIRLILIDEIDEIVVDGEEMQPMCSDEQRRKDSKLLDELENSFGSPKTSVSGRRRRKGPAHHFGGHDIVSHTLQVAFTLSSAGLIKHGFAALQEWLRANSNRTFCVEQKDHSGRLRKFKATSVSLKQFQKMIAAVTSGADDMRGRPPQGSSKSIQRSQSLANTRKKKRKSRQP
jgi:hypothetical protein